MRKEEGTVFLSICDHFTLALSAFTAAPTGQILYMVFYHFTPALSGFCSFWLLLQLILYTVTCLLLQTRQTSAEICPPLKSGT